MMQYPKISIVTPSFNQAHFLEATIKSILGQNYPNLEYIIIDGGSTDGSVEIIKKYSSQLSYWVSEKDNGQSHAINKGLEKCTGVIFNWINSDDLLVEGALLRIANEYIHYQFDMLAGVVEDFDDKSNYTAKVKNENLSPENMLMQENGIKFHQPGVWLITEKVKTIGGINENFHYCFDWHLLIRYLINYNNVRYTDDCLVRFRLHQASKTMSQPLKFTKDTIDIAKELMDLPYFSGINSRIYNWLRYKQWYLKLQVISESKQNLVVKILLIIINIPVDPMRRISRYTAGTIRNLIQGKHDH
ncbi:MAG: glycosyltransferase family 2 protein [Cytophagaceae bacterium]